MKQIDWFCPSCREVIGTVSSGELQVSGLDVETNGTNLFVRCGNCGRVKVWFSRLDVSAIVDAFLREFARR